MDIPITILISAISVCFAVYFGLKNQKRSDTADVAERAATQARVEAKLDSINSTVQEMRYDVSSLHKESTKQNERLVLVENSTKRAHERIDIIQGR